MSFMSDFKKMDAKRKLAFGILAPASAIMLLFGMYRNITEPTPQKKIPTHRQETSAKNSQNNKASENASVSAKHQNGNNKNDIVDYPTLKSYASGIPVSILFSQNPFIDLSRYAISTEDGNNAENGGATTARNRNVHVPNSHLPAIPTGNVPAPSIPSPGNAPIAVSGGGGGASTAAPPKVQGILVGGDGENMAIMSDGSVVSQGDPYDESRIAYIGGDGIKLENGKTFDYK